MILRAEQEYLLRSIIKNENWIIAPQENYFYNILNDIYQYSTDDYKPVAKELITSLKNYDYMKVKSYINQLILTEKKENI